MTLEEARELLLIDKNELDTVCIQHPPIFFDISDQAALATATRDQAKEEMERVWAKEAQKVRAGAEKVTEKIVEERVTNSVEYTEAKDAFLEAKYEADRWSAVKDAFMQRAGMIRSLCDLFVTGHYNVTTVQSPKPKQAGYKQNRDKIVNSKE